MDRSTRLAFLLLILAQAAHSVEEYAFRLYDLLPPALPRRSVWLRPAGRLRRLQHWHRPVRPVVLVRAGPAAASLGARLCLVLGPAPSSATASAIPAWRCWRAAISPVLTAPFLLAAGGWLALRLIRRDARMTARVLVIGGYGNFGSYIARALGDVEIRLLIAGRSQAKAGRSSPASMPPTRPRRMRSRHFRRSRPGNRGGRGRHRHPQVGPFQGQDSSRRRGLHRRRRALSRPRRRRAPSSPASALDRRAKQAGVAIVAGASSVPCLSAAIVDHYRPSFARLDAVDYGISAAQQTNRGLATASAVLSYIGRPFTTLEHGEWVTIHGWQDSTPRPIRARPPPVRQLRHSRSRPVPARYPDLKSVRFGAGHEVALLHLGTWALSGARPRPSAAPARPFFRRLLGASSLFDRFGISRSGLHMVSPAPTPRAARKGSASS